MKKEPPHRFIEKRLSLGMSQHGLSDASGVGRSTIAALEAGASRPTLKTAIKLAAALKCSPMTIADYFGVGDVYIGKEDQ